MTLEDKGSDLRRVYLTRLCCVFELSQLLDALFRLYPFRLYFIPITPLSFCLRRFSLPGSCLVSRPPVPPCRFFYTLTSTVRKHWMPGMQLATSRFYIQGIRSTHNAMLLALRCRSSRDFFPFGVSSPRYLAPCFHGASSHGL